MYTHTCKCDVYVLCSCIYAWVQVSCACEGQRSKLGVVFSCSPSWCLRTKSGAHWFDWTGWPASPVDLPVSSSPALGSQAYTTMSGCLCERLRCELIGSTLLTPPSFQASQLCYILPWVRVSDIDEQSEQLDSIQLEWISAWGTFCNQQPSSLSMDLDSWRPSRALQLRSPEMSQGIHSQAVVLGKMHLCSLLLFCIVLSSTESKLI